MKPNELKDLRLEVEELEDKIAPLSTDSADRFGHVIVCL
jgi:hypothetical protein